MINSDTFGMTFWLDDDNEFCYCPTFIDNKPDKDNWGYVSEWTDFDGVDLDESNLLISRNICKYSLN